MVEIKLRNMCNSKRKYLLDTVIEAFEPPEREEADQSEPDDDEPFRKRHNV